MIILEGLPSISVGDTETVSIDFSEHLDSGELLTGTPTVIESDSATRQFAREIP